MRFFVLYDEQGNAVQLSTARSIANARKLIGNGFVEVAESIYRAFQETVDEINVAKIGTIIAAGGLLARLLTSRPDTKAIPKPPQSLVDELAVRFRDTVQRHTSNYLSGEMTLNEWYVIMSREVRKLHLAAGAIGAGGWENLGGNAMEEVLAQVREHIDFLLRFRDEIQKALDDNLPFSDRLIIARARMYSGGAYATAEMAHTATLGMPRLPAYPGVLTGCYSGCKCSWDIRQLPGNGNWDCYWDRSPVDSCDECLARERAFSPLRIREGKILPYSSAGIYR